MKVNFIKPTNQNRTWTDEEEALIIEVMTKVPYGEKGKAMREVAEKIDRTPKACDNRWRDIKNRDKEQNMLAVDGVIHFSGHNICSFLVNNRVEYMKIWMYSILQNLQLTNNRIFYIEVNPERISHDLGIDERVTMRMMDEMEDKDLIEYMSEDEKCVKYKITFQPVS